MAWTDRIREAAYTSPSGERTVFTYEDVSQSVEKKTTGYEFPDADGTYVQDLGHSGRRYPLRVIFWGADYDQEADRFTDGLLERGVGKLEHPRYGVKDVIPFGTIKQRDDLKTNANQAIIEVTFWETIGLIYPAAQQDPAAAVLESVDEYNDAAAGQFEEVVQLDTVSRRASFKGDYDALIGAAEQGLRVVADAQDAVRKQFNAINDSINQGIDVLIAQPLTLAFQTTQLLQAPARALSGIEARLDAYGNLAGSIISGNGAVVKSDEGVRGSNRFHARDLYASSYVTGSVVSVVNRRFTTKTEALEAAEAVLDQFQDVAAWRDDNFQALAQVDTGEAYQKLQEAVALTAGFLVEISFSLKQERRIVLDRARTIIDLAAELYGSVDDQLDFLINSNSLTGSEILELPRGREIVYYV